MKILIKKLEAAFIVWARKNKQKESERIELDNLDEAKLILKSKNEVVVENEHGTEFQLSDLSKVECEIFLYLLATN